MSEFKPAQQSCEATGCRNRPGRARLSFVFGPRGPMLICPPCLDEVIAQHRGRQGGADHV